MKLCKLLKQIVCNPLIIGCILGMLFLVLNVKLPAVVEKAVIDISKIASPLAVIILGATFKFSSAVGYVREIFIIVFARLVLVPLVMVCSGVMLGFSGESLACILIVFGSPVAVSSFVMAQQMGGDERLANQVVVISSALCLVTLFFWIFALDFIGLF